MKFCVLRYSYWIFKENCYFALLSNFSNFECKCAQDGTKKRKTFSYKHVLEFNYATINGLVQPICSLMFNRFVVFFWSYMFQSSNCCGDSQRTCDTFLNIVSDSSLPYKCLWYDILDIMNNQMCTNIAGSSVFPDNSLQSWSRSRLINFSQFKNAPHSLRNL